MTAYEFTKLNYSKEELKKTASMSLEPRMVAKNILSRMKVNLRESQVYKNAMDIFIELTMSCSAQEANSWLKHWMLVAVTYGMKTKDLDWRCYFLAAWDITQKNF